MNKITRYIRSAVRLSLLPALILQANTAHGKVLHATPDSVLQQLIEQAAPGDTIRLEAGVYHEKLIISNRMTLVGEDLPEIRGNYEENVVHITAPGTVLRGIKVTQSGRNLSRDNACILVEADSVTVVDCSVAEPLHGIYVKGGSWVNLIRNRIEGRLDLIEADRGNGIHLWNSHSNRIISNEILNVRDGIYFSFADSTEVFGNYIHQVRYGLHYMYSNENLFEENRFEENVAGAALMYSNNIVFRKNLFARCRGFRAYGILFQSMDSTLCEDNLVLDNSRGIFLNNADFNIIRNNDVIDNDLAIQQNGGCDGNLIVANNFMNNLSDLILDVSDENTRWNDDTGGNHWTGYHGYDLTGDAIGDVPYTIQRVFQVMETRIPEVRFYLFSPAAKILEIAERSLPILNLGRAEDPLPLMRPQEHDQTAWRLADDRKNASSPAAAGIYLGGIGGMLLILFRWLKKGNTRRSSGVK